MIQNNQSRRRFIQRGSLAIAGALSGSLRSFANVPFEPYDTDITLLHNIPAEKQLDPQWVKSLYERGEPTCYRKSKNELKYIGMPAGGLHSGTVYLGGDGRLWLWGIYNDDREGIDPKTVLWNDGTGEVKVRNRDGASYIEPAIAANKRMLEQGFAVKLNFQNKSIIKELKEEDWEEVIFEATYPVATIKYIDKNLPVDIIVKAGALFIPLDPDNSALPATVFAISIKNRSATAVEATVCGWFENGANKVTARDEDGSRQNAAVRTDNYLAVSSSFNPGNMETAQQRDAGTTCVACIGLNGQINTSAKPWLAEEALFVTKNESRSEKKPSEKLVGSIATSQVISPGKTMEANYALSWHFDHPLSKRLDKLPETKGSYYYGHRFKDALEVADYIARNFKRLHTQTLLWQQTYYDSTLPYWFLERTFLNIGTLATANTYRFANGRFWGWEGVNACEGTCTHVWQYAQAMARIFPSLERDCRERTDLGIAMHDDGGIVFRAEYETRPAIDGQAGTILRFYREHQMSANDTFLTTNWKRIKKAVSFMLAQDRNGDGMTDTPMENTLDAVWEGEIAWIAGLCIAAARAAQLMAEEMKDDAFAHVCREYVEKGSKNMADKLFNGEYFIHRPDEKQGRKKLGSYNTCHIDQVYGQGWAWQVGLGRLWDKHKTLSALRALWKYNFAPDVGPYIKTHTGGRPYAVAGEAGMVMNTNPHNEPMPYGDSVTWQLGYFHECMSGFEHQVASHMMAEGMVDEALVLTRTVHDRYHAAKRNPFNEIECSDHYARAMASYGTFITACGFEYHGPKGYIRFAPKWNKTNFKTPFTLAEGWGTYTQKLTATSQQHSFDLKYGTARLQQFCFESIDGRTIKQASVTTGIKKIATVLRQEGTTVFISLQTPIIMQENQKLWITLA